MINPIHTNQDGGIPVFQQLQHVLNLMGRLIMDIINIVIIRQTKNKWKGDGNRSRWLLGELLT